AIHVALSWRQRLQGVRHYLRAKTRIVISGLVKRGKADIAQSLQHHRIVASHHVIQITSYFPSHSHLDFPLDAPFQREGERNMDRIGERQDERQSGSRPWERRA